MKKILLLIISILIVSCGSRSVDRQKKKEKTSEKTGSEASVKIHSDSQTKWNFSKTDSSSVKKISENISSEKSKENAENTSEKNHSENSSRTEKVTEYYENGNKKSERETSESVSKITHERDYWKASAESLKEENIKQEETIKSLTASNGHLAVKNKKLTESIEKHNSSVETRKSDQSKKIKKETYPFWIFILIGFMGNSLLKLLWNKLKQSTWQLKIWDQLNKKR